MPGSELRRMWYRVFMYLNEARRIIPVAITDGEDYNKWLNMNEPELALYELVKLSPFKDPKTPEFRKFNLRLLEAAVLLGLDDTCAQLYEALK